MQKLETCLDKYNNKNLSDKIYKKYCKFGYTNEELYKLHLDFMLNNLYNIKLIKHTRKRLNQAEFRKKILKKFNYNCVVTNETCPEELAAAHIIPVSEDENYDIDNGLLLRENIHKTFDNFKWSINPETFTIEIKKDTNVGQIRDYEGKRIVIDINNNIKEFLRIHYEKFKK